MHIHESTTEIKQSINDYDTRPLSCLDKLGFLSQKLTAVHMVKLNEDEIDLCAKGKINITHCPHSNLKLANGFCKVGSLDKKGINFTIGTDGTASNNDLDMFSELCQSALLAKAVSKDARVLPAYKSLEMATINATKALGIDGIVGSLTVGRVADMVAVDFSGVESKSCYNVISQLVHAASRFQVSYVWIAGK